MSQSTQRQKFGKRPLVNGKRVGGLVLGQYKGFDGRKVVVIATFQTTNRKTGDMVQIWILRSYLAPITVLLRGLDKSICGTCPHRSVASKGQGTCYVNVRCAQAVWKAWKRGSYAEWDGSDAQLTACFQDRAVRFGAYGDPVLIPADLVSRIRATTTEPCTGYTHAWTSAAEHAAFFMASVDSPDERDNARSHGWRTFQVTPIGGVPSLASDGMREILCPASDEAGKLTDCATCGLCAGNGRPAATAGRRRIL